MPGYVAPRQTVGPATRVTRVLLALVAEAAARGVAPSAGPARAAEGPDVHAALAGVREFAGADLPDDLLLAGLAAWSGLVGGVTLELFGHLDNAVGDRDAWFEALTRRLCPFAAPAEPEDVPPHP